MNKLLGMFFGIALTFYLISIGKAGMQTKTIYCGLRSEFMEVVNER